MSIKNELDVIGQTWIPQNASKVRQAIHDILIKTYDTASENGNANMEVEIARGTHPNLRSRLEEVDNKQKQTASQLAQTADELTKTHKKSEQTIAWANITQEVREQIVGETPPAYVGVDSVGKENIIRRSIDTGHLSEELIRNDTINLLDESKSEWGGYYGAGAGGWTETDNYRSSGLIECFPGDVFTNNAFMGNLVTYWDATLNFVTGVNLGQTGSQSFTVPSESSIRYFRINMLSDIDPKATMIVRGNTLPNDYHPYKPTVIDVSSENLQEGSVTAEKLGSADGIANKVNSYLFNDGYEYVLDESKTIPNGYYGTATGDWVVGNSRSSDLIPCKSGDIFRMSDIGRNVTYWDGSEAFVSGETLPLNTTRLIIPDNSTITYFRIDIPSRITKENTWIVKGEVIPSRFNKDYDLVKLDKTNLLDKKEFINGSFYRVIDRGWRDDSTYRSTGFIPCKSGEVFSRTLDPLVGGDVTYFDINKNFVTGRIIGSTGESFIVPDFPEIEYLTINFRVTADENKLMLVRGSKLPTKYVAHGEVILQVTTENIDDGAVTYEKIHDTVFDKIKQRLDKKKNYLKPFNRVQNPILTRHDVTDRVDPTGVADPFIVQEKGVYHMFFEVLQGVNPTTGNKGDEIGHAYSYDLVEWTYTQIVMSIEDHGHRSAYPNVFKIEGTWYMLPDTTGPIKLYEAATFPYEWELVNDIIPSGNFVDTNIFEMDSTWYMTTTDGDREGISLYVNTSGDWKNDQWTPHPSGLIVKNEGLHTGYRNAGNPIVYDDYILFPVQDRYDGVYGYQTHLYKLINLSPTTAEAVNLGLLVGAQHNEKWNDMSMHHVSHTSHMDSRIFTTDGRERDNQSYSIGLYVSDCYIG